MSQSFDPLLIPHNATPDDLVRAFIGTGIPAALAAAGSSKTDAAVVVNRSSLVTGADGTKGVILAASDLSGSTRVIVNGGTAALKVYPDSGGTIDGRAADLPILLAPAEGVVLVKTAALTYVTLGRPRSYFDATATTTGATTGTIPSIGSDIFVTVTCDDANKIVILPAPVPGTQVTLVNAGTGYELRSSSPTTVAINGGTASNAESAIGANVVVHCKCVTATRWIAFQQSTNGTVSATEAAAT